MKLYITNVNSFLYREIVILCSLLFYQLSWLLLVFFLTLSPHCFLIIILNFYPNDSHFENKFVDTIFKMIDFTPSANFESCFVPVISLVYVYILICDIDDCLKKKIIIKSTNCHFLLVQFFWLALVYQRHQSLDVCW